MGSETELVEFKRTTAEQKLATDSMVAMLNRSGAGTLFFGVKDNGDVLGQGVSDKTLREVSQTIRLRVFPAIYPTINKVNVQGKTCIRVDVQGTDVSYSSAGVYYMRVHDEDVQMTRDMLADMLRRKDAEVHPWDSEPSRRSLADVDEDELRRYVRHGNEKGRIRLVERTGSPCALR